MKRVILAAAFVVAFSGFAAAQSTSAKQASNKTVKKTVPVKTNAAHTVLRQETSANAKSDSTIKLVLAVPQISDTTALPPVKKDEEL